MFDDMTIEQLNTLRTDLRLAYTSLVSGGQPAEIRYADHGEKFHPTSVTAIDSFLSKVVAEIKRRTGGRAGGFTVMHGG